MKSILIVDDDHLMSHVYRDKFQTIGFEAVVAETGRGAVEWLKRTTPSVVLLDLMLPDITGVQVLEEIRAHERSRHVPVLVFTNAYMGELVQAAWKAGADKCLSKTSCSPNRLVDEVNMLIAAKAKPAAPPHAPSPAAATPPPLPAARPAPDPLPAPTGDERIQAQLRREMVETIRQKLADARHELQEVVRHITHEDPASELVPLFRAIHAIAGSAGLCGFPRLAQVAAATEALVKDIQTAPKKINASTLRTMTQAIELLPALFRNTDALQTEIFLTPLIMVVDDDPVSRETLAGALERVYLRALSIDDPRTALRLGESNRFDLVLLDVDMPEMTGFELCEKLHLSSENLMTPVVFVTALADFETRSHSTESGGTDFIAKPVVPSELAAKALIHLHRGRLIAAM